jgi:peptide/nickel transport system substrate-binding protein
MLRHPRRLFNRPGWTCTGADVQEMLDFVLHTRGPGTRYGVENVGGYSNPELDRLIGLARDTLRRDLRLELLQRAGRLVLDDVAVVPLFVPRDRYGLRRGLDWKPRADRSILGWQVRRGGA